MPQHPGNDAGAPVQGRGLSRREWALLALGPLLALLAPSIVLRCISSYWGFAGTFVAGSPMHVEGLLRTTPPGLVNIVILGSSLAIGDVDETHLDRVLTGRGSRSLNLGVLGAPLCATAMLLPQVLALEPRVVVLVLHPLDLRSNDSIEGARTYNPMVAARLFEPRSFFSDRQFHLEGAASWSFVLHRHRAALRQWFLEGGQRAAGLHPRRYPKLQGALLESTFHEFFRREAALRLNDTGPNAEALRYLTAELHARRIALVVSPAPIHPLASAEQHTFHPRLAQLLARLEPELGFFRIPGANLGAYAASDFIDPYHLGSDGQRRYTEAIARMLDPLLVEMRNAPP